MSHCPFVASHLVSGKARDDIVEKARGQSGIPKQRRQFGGRKKRRKTISWSILKAVKPQHEPMKETFSFSSPNWIYWFFNLNFLLPFPLWLLLSSLLCAMPAHLIAVFSSIACRVPDIANCGKASWIILSDLGSCLGTGPLPLTYISELHFIHLFDYWFCFGATFSILKAHLWVCIERSLLSGLILDDGNQNSDMQGMSPFHCSIFLAFCF